MGKPSGSFAAANSGIKKGPWTPEEDTKLLAFIQLHGHGSWRSLPQKAGLKRCGKSCRLRWRNYLRPDIKRGNFSLHEDRNIIQLHALLGNRWSAIAKHLPNRTDNEIKNYWNTHLKKRLAKIGFDPVTHKPTTAILGSADGDPKNLSNLSHIAQWESARLQAEARFVKESKQRQYEIAAAPPPPLVSHEAASRGPPQYFVPQCINTSAWEDLTLTSSSSAAPATTNCSINGQDDSVVSFGDHHHQAHHVDVDICNVNVNFDAPAFDQYLPGTMEYDGITTTGSSPRDIGNEYSELLAAFYQHNMAF